MKDYADYLLYRICPSCHCYLQRSSPNLQSDPTWINLPENLRNYPKTCKIKKFYLLLAEWLVKTRNTTGLFLQGKERPTEGIDALLKQGWKLRAR